MCSVYENTYPEAFKKDKVELEDGKWYVGYHYADRFLVNLDLTDELETHDKGYGFNKFGWVKEFTFLKTFDWGFELATPEEVTEALTKEAVKRYKVGDFIKCPVYESCNYIGTIHGDIYWADGSKVPAVRCINTNRPNENFSLFFEGKWAEIIPTISKEDAEKEIGKKILN